jgi:hypothetical protein
LDKDSAAENYRAKYKGDADFDDGLRIVNHAVANATHCTQLLSDDKKGYGKIPEKRRFSTLNCMLFEWIFFTGATYQC